MTWQNFDFLDVETASAIHDEVLQNYGGGSPGVLDPGILESAIEGVKQVAYYQDLTVFEVAAKYGFKLIKNHCFCDGNKRTGISVAAAFLYAHGFALSAPEPALAQVAVDVATDVVSESDLAEWLKTHSVESPLEA
jgi:death-on-curing protein